MTIPSFRRRSLLALALALPAMVGACSPVSTFNTVAGRDGGSELAASDVPFGTHPRQKLDIYKPVNIATPAPVVMFIYGGSWNSGERVDYAFAGRALAALGYVTVVADYRLVPEVVFPSFLDDGALAVRWVRDNIKAYGGDGSRVALVGHSAGAYNAAMLALDPRHLRRAGVDPASVKAFVGLAGPYDFYPFTSPFAQAAMAAWPKPEETQPVAFARRGAPPALLAHGSADATVNPRNTVTLAARLRSRGAIVTERLYADVDHAGILIAMSRLLRGRAPVIEDIRRFLDEHMPVARR